MTNYSIIIPHKNIPNLLQRCLDSIPYREDVQIIVVDDNSDITEVNGISLLTLPELYPNVEFIFGKNESGRKGAGYARNLGLERANGKWLIFADADDFFNPCFAEALDKYKDDESDIVFFKATSINAQTQQEGWRHDYINDILDEIKRHFDIDVLLKLHTPVCKFIRLDFLKENDIYFQEISHANDVLFSVKLTIAHKNRIISDDKIYCITERNDSLIGLDTVDSLQTRFFAACDTVEYLKKMNKQSICADDVCNMWIRLRRLGFKNASCLINKMIRTCGFRFTVKYILVDDVKNYKRTLIWRFLKKCRSRLVGDNNELKK